METVYHSDIASQGLFSIIFSQLPGEGVGVRGNPIAGISTLNPALDEGLGSLQDQSAACSPPHPWPLSRVGVRELKSIEFLERQ